LRCYRTIPIRATPAAAPIAIGTGVRSTHLSTPRLSTPQPINPPPGQQIDPQHSSELVQLHGITGGGNGVIGTNTGEATVGGPCRIGGFDGGGTAGDSLSGMIFDGGPSGAADVGGMVGEAVGGETGGWAAVGAIGMTTVGLISFEEYMEFLFWPVDEMAEPYLIQ